jgi:mRNA interferase HigB
MKNIVALRTLRLHWEKRGRGDSEQALKTWYQEVKKVHWKSPHCVKEQFRNVSVIGANVLVFNICGNKYRLVVKVNYAAQWVFILFVGTHEEYDQLNLKNKSS